MSTKFKKGQWVVTPYNKYPFRLEEDGAFGIFDNFGFSGKRFFKFTETEAEMAGKPLIYAVRDSRAELAKCAMGWYEVSQVRLATKTDLKLMVDQAKKKLEDANFEFKYYKKAMDKLKV